MSGDALAGSQTTVSLSAVLVSVAERLQARFNTVVHDLPRQTAENRLATELGLQEDYHASIYCISIPVGSTSATHCPLNPSTAHLLFQRITAPADV
jgi:hypothetical protein